MPSRFIVVNMHVPILIGMSQSLRQYVLSQCLDLILHEKV